MVNVRGFLAAVLALGFWGLVQAQTTTISVQSLRSGSAIDLETMFKAIEATEPVPAWDLDDDYFLLDDLNVSDTSTGLGMRDMSMSLESTSTLESGYEGPVYGSNDLWLEIMGVSNGLAYLNLHNATDEVYEVWSKIDLLAPSWNIEQEVWPGTNQDIVPFTVSQLDRTNLFIWARDWTGIDENSNGIPDWWEYKYFGHLGVDPNADPDGDGLSNLQEYQAGTDPTDYYNGNLPNIIIISGNNQRGLPGEFLPGALTAQLTGTNGVLLINAPVTFTVTNGGGLIAASSGGATSSSLQLRTGTNGEASVWLQLPATNGTNFVTVSAQSGTNTEQINFTEIAGILSVIAIGGERIMELTTNGDVVSWGGNHYGELGDYTFLDSSNAVHVVGLTNIIKIASGLNHSLAIDANGALWAWGDNQLAQLGDGDLNATNWPVQVSGMTNSVVAVAGGSGSSSGNYEISVAVKADGTVWTWGSKYEGSDEIHTVIPTQVEGLTNVIAVAAGVQHFLALSIDGTVWAAGSDNLGQLGDGMAGGGDTPVQVSGLSNIVAICAGDNHSLALDTNGCVWAWGLNESGQLGDGGTEAANGLPVLVFSNAVQIAAGANHSLVLDNESNVWAWGNDGSGQLGDGGPGNNGGLYNTNIPMQILELTNIIAIAAGSDASVALDSNGNLWQWGASDSDGTNWMWGDETWLPALAPQYDDFYDGQLPNLTILDGNNQTPHVGLEFPQPLVFQVTDTNGVALSNAPVSVEVIAGDMELRTVSGGDNYKGLRLTTDTNGEVSLIGYADQNFSNPNCVVRVLAASRERIVEADFNETFVPPPTISITSPGDGSTYLVGTNQPLTITVDAEAAPGASIQEVDYEYGTNGVGDTTLGSSTQSPFSFVWTNALWRTNAFVGQYTLSAVAVDNLGGRSDPQSVTITIALDSDGIGIPDYWQLQYFGYVGVDPNSSPDGNGQSLLYDYQNGTDPTDYYNGNLPNLGIISGNNQGGNYDSFLPFPVIIGVTDANSVALTNAPVTFTVTNGTALLALATSDVPTNTLSLRTDTNGQASAWVYFPPSSSNPPDSTIEVTAFSGANSNAIIVNEHVVLGHWRFNDTNSWIGEEGQLPLLATNVVGVPSWSKNAALLDSTNPALLVHRVVETNGNANINFQQGSVQFWFKPDWGSSDTGGDGPGNSGRLIEAGNYDSAFTNGWWSLYLSPDGTQLLFGTSTNGGGMTNLCANISWFPNQWHQILLTYSPTASDLYLDGQWVTNGTGVTYLPNADEQSNGFRIGSDPDGYNQAGGTFEELEIFSGPLNVTFVYGSFPLAPPTIGLLVTNESCLVTLEQNRANDIASSVTGLIYPNFVSFMVADNYADAVFAERPGYMDGVGQGINITVLPSPVITPNSGLITAPANITISLGTENLKNLASGLYQTELGRTGNPAEIQTVVAYAQELRSQGNSDEQIRTSLINSAYFRNSAEYISMFGGPGDVYQANTNYTIEYSLDNGTTWTTYTIPIQIASTVTLHAKVEKTGNSDNRTHYAYLASDISVAQFDYIPASWLEQYFGADYQSNTNAAPGADPDHDGLSNLQEYQLGTNPTNADTDGDGINDGAEVAAGSDPLNAASVPDQRLGYWRFDTTNWLGEEGQVPLSFSNLVSVPDWSDYALGVDNSDRAYLAYRDVETNGSANITLRNGSIRFWFKPDWNSSTTNSGTGPGSLARLIEIGSQDSTDGWWALVASADGTTLSFVTQTNGIGVTNLSATINWTSNDWHQVVLTYSATNSLLYLDGQLAANGVEVTNYPDAPIRANGFYIGSDNQGNNQARAQFDELETFNYALSTSSILDNYNLLTPGGGGPVDYIEYLEGRNPSVHGAAVPDTNGVINLQTYTPLR
jgi:alpha-tubulin suppressor-like RCC1 family protein